MSTESEKQKRTSRTTKSNGGGTRKRSANAGMGASLFEVSSEDVESLKDDELRELVARLCKATLLEERLPTTCVTWGGDQREPDGGIDVRVQLRAVDPLPNGSWLRWRSVGFQVKATEMPPAKIKKEMCPNDSLQSSIQELLQVGGAYIIAARDSVADQRYKERVAAMRECAAGLLQDGNSGCVDYYDSRRLADWASEYPTVVAWLHSKKQGGALHGWGSYGQWATSERMPDGNYPPFLPDEKARLIDLNYPGRVFNLIEGVERVRDVLREGGRSVRLVGLSGVGKTRFVQALFETGVGLGRLDESLAVYADIGRETIPPPDVVLERLIASKKRAVLIIDNCVSALHRRLVKQLGSAPFGTRVSLLTVEYDIREDLPEDTNAFRLEGASISLIEEMVRVRFQSISGVDSETIARFSDGNFRIAIALAGSVGKKGSLAGLSDSELFDRLFFQRHGEDDGLRGVAEICSLVYSFDGMNGDGELKALADLAEISVQKLRRFVSILEDRGLIQRRGVWCAVLPQAIANRLAADALRYVTYDSIRRCVVGGGINNESRLLRSFSRRLGYLHESGAAREIVKQWLLPDGLIGGVLDLERWPFYSELLSNVSPVDPEGALHVIECLTGNGCSNCIIDGYKSAIVGDSCKGGSFCEGVERIIMVLRSIAYEGVLFDRCLNVLLKFAAVEEGLGNLNKRKFACEILESMFFVRLSGTHAKTNRRLIWLEGVLRSGGESVRSVACRCLSNALESQEFWSHCKFDFGSRTRDFGWQPSDEQKRDWLKRFVNLSVEIGRGELPVSSAVREILASRFRILWLIGMKDELAEAVRALSLNGWEEGSVAIRDLIKYDSKEIVDEDMKMLRDLEDAIRPQGLLSRLRVAVLSFRAWETSLGDGGVSELWRYDKVQNVRGLGWELVQEGVNISKAAHFLVGLEGGRDSLMKYVLGKSMATHAFDMTRIWGVLLEEFGLRPDGERDAAVLKGFLEGVSKRSPELFDVFLDDVEGKSSLVRYIPFLQSCAPFDGVACARLLRLMDGREIFAGDFVCIGYARSFQMASDEDVAIVLERLLKMEGGSFASIRILACYIRGGLGRVGACLLRVAYDVLEVALLLWVGRGVKQVSVGDLDFDFKSIIEYFWGYGVDEGVAEDEARRILRRLVEKGKAECMWPVFDFKEGMKAIFDVRTEAALDILVGDDGGIEDWFRRSSFQQGYSYSSISGVSVDVLVRWCRAGGECRWVNIACIIPAIVPSANSGISGCRWQWSSQVVSFLAQAPNPSDVAGVLVKRLCPVAWSVSEAEALRQRLPLLDQLESMLDVAYSDKVEEWRKWLRDKIYSREQWEADYLAKEGFE